MSIKLIRNAHIATSAEVFHGSVLIDGEKIVQLFRTGEVLPLLPVNAEIFEAQGKYLLPGGVDPHTRLGQSAGAAHSPEDFYTGSVAAACGGTTTIIQQLAFGPAGVPLSFQLSVAKKPARAAVIDYGFHAALQRVDDDVLRDMETLRDREGITSLGATLAGPQRLNDADLLQALVRAQQLGLTLCLHCENEAATALLARQLAQAGHTDTRYFARSRPPQAEAEAVFRALMLAKMAGEARLYVQTLSSALGLNALHLARSTGQRNIFAETTPPYLFLDAVLYNNPADGPKYLAAPPLRTEADRDALWSGLAAADIDTVASGHLAFRFATQKQQGGSFAHIPPGMPSAELRLPLMFSEGFMKGWLSLPQLVRACCTRPAQIFGIAPQKGDIAPGADADLVLFDPAVSWTVAQSQLHENVDYTPYEGMRLTGWPMLTFSRGEVIAAGRQFIGAAGRGRTLKRTAAPGA
ncbi:MAG: dihydropyrimidinase [Ruminococcaceae bacterium]|nr:dihydropyrimidinase [Oscillospiraceae bacterium]